MLSQQFFYHRPRKKSRLSTDQRLQEKSKKEVRIKILAACKQVLLITEKEMHATAVHFNGHVIVVLICSIWNLLLRTTHHVSFADVAGPSTECGSAVNACFHTYIPVEPSTFSGCLYSQGIDDNDITFDSPLEELQMQVKEPNVCKHTRDDGCQVNT